MLLGADGVHRLAKAHVAVFGIGGVGSYAVEALARSGIETFSLFDHDRVSLSNINRQLIATTATVGRFKTAVMKERILQINPSALVTEYNSFFSSEIAAVVPFQLFDYLVDAIDTVTSKILLAETAEALGIPMISAMGAGNKLDATRFEVADIYETAVCPLAKVMRKELKARGVRRLKTVYSKEPAIKPQPCGADMAFCEETGAALPDRRKQPPGSVAFVPSVAGLILAGEVVKDLICI